MQSRDGSIRHAICLLRPTLLTAATGDACSPRPSLRRSLLELLAMSAQRPVATAVIVEELWAGAPPLQPEQAVQAHVARLRKTLTRLGWSETELQVCTVGGGYMLDVAPARVDALYFEQLVHEATAMSTTCAEAAIRALDLALAVWQGQPFGGVVDGECHRIAAQYWEELRTLALRTWAEAQLRLNRPQAAVARLHPEGLAGSADEGLNTILITALCRIGRKVEAMEVYRSLHNRLVRDYGIEPSPELKSLYQRILLDKADTRFRFLLPSTTTAP
ncbi:BTAD domain-containing putative transcriptional regulator [Streptomyces sp. NPDC013161]|uniref:AfsR/SARP family transcriptional regulator n=1 Tax=Streptomyces sp. NPDC013161 TaxID=3364862 RepID=UPI0036CB5EEA